MPTKLSSLGVAVALAFIVPWGGACGGAGSPMPEAVGSSVAADSTECNDGPYVDGIDVYDGTGAIDWGSVRGAGVLFAIIKATQGNYDTQATFASHWSGAKRAGVVRGAYHFFDPTVDGVLQADYFLEVVGTPEPQDLPPMLDIECPDGDADCLYSGASGAESPDVIQARMNDWLTTVKARTGRVPIVYSFGSYFVSNGIDTSGLENHPLDIAYPTTKECFELPTPWQKATFWQNSWSATVSGIAGPVDTERFLGSLSQFRSFIEAGAPRAMGARDAGGDLGPPAHDGGCSMKRRADDPCSVSSWLSGAALALVAMRRRGRSPSAAR
jgi:GH25 family lysozyme M1 (1,4-beta-N-acetylmuramidase)